MKHSVGKLSVDWEDVFRAISDLAMILDEEHRILAVNPAVERATGLNREKLLGRYCYKIFHGLDHPPEGCPHETLLKSSHPETMDMEMEVLNGTYLVTVAPIMDETGQFVHTVHIAKDITERRQYEETIKKINTALKAVTEFNQALARAEDESWLLHELCRILLQIGGYCMAWVGYLSGDKEKNVRPVAHAGFEEGYIDIVNITARNCERGRGPTGTAVRIGKPVICQDINTDPHFESWRSEAIKRGYASSIAIPLMAGDTCMGTLNIYAPEPYRFDDEETRLLSELADDLVYGVMSIRAREAHKAAERALKISEEKYRMLVETANDAIFVSDVETGIIIDVNRRAEKMLGIPAEKIIGLHHTEIHPPEERERYREIFRKHVGMERVISDDIWVINKEGQRIPVQVSASTCTFQGRRIIQGIFRDMTERRMLEQQLVHAQKLEAIGTLAGGIAHDFNNILVPIMGYGELIINQLPRDNKLCSYAMEIVEGAKRARDLVRQILTFSRKGEEERRPLQLQPIVKETLKFLQSIIPSNIEIRVNTDSEAGPVFCNPTHIHQMIMNLCTNAYQAMGEKGGLIEIVVDSVDIGEGDFSGDHIQPGKYVRFTVRDNGIGMDRETVSRIFEPYFTTKDTGQGTGLGLAVVYGIVTIYNGHIEVYSRVGEGTSFQIYLPEFGGIPEDATESLGSASSLKGSERILLVDDEESVVLVIQSILEELGYQVTSFTKSMDALASFRAAPSSFDLVITDQTMPNMLGFDLAQKILDIRPDIPVILCSGYNDFLPEDQTGEKTGIRAFLTKPVNRVELAKWVREVLDSK